MRYVYFFIVLAFIACNTPKQEPPKVDDRVMIFNVWSDRRVPSHSITVDFANRSVLVHNTTSTLRFDLIESLEAGAPKGWESPRKIFPLGYIEDVRLSHDTDFLFHTLDSIWADGKDFDCGSLPPTCGHIGFDFTLLKNGQCLSRCGQFSNKVLELAYPISIYLEKHDTVNASRWELLWDHKLHNQY